MKKILPLLVLSTVLFSCAPFTSNGVPSALFTSWSDRDPISRVDNNISPTKSGTSCVKFILGIASFGDSSIETAKKDGNINQVSNVDRTYYSFLGLYQKGCTVVKGN